MLTILLSHRNPFTKFFFAFAFSFTLFSSPLYAQGFTEVYAGGALSTSAVGYSGVAWGDYDNDGDLDILLTGLSGTTGTYISRIYQNTGSGFTEVYAGSLTGVHRGSAMWGDYDRDGDLDILIAGSDNSNVYSSKIYQNTGSGFTEVYAGSLTGVYQGCAAWGDYDNDGDLDIVLSGFGTGSTYISKIYQNTGSGFTEVYAGSLMGLGYSGVAWGDYDNDGDLDIALSGHNGTTAVSKIYQNTGSGFTEVYAGSLSGGYYSSIAWGDYDKDGDLDLLISQRHATNGLGVSKIYQNTGSGFTEVYAGSLYGLYYGTIAWGDYDNDGDLDIFNCGTDNTSRFSKIYQNTGTGFTEVFAGSISAASEWASCAWGDYDNDGDLDLLVTSAYFTKLYRNNGTTFNTVPNTPSGLTTTISGSNATLRWNKTTDTQTPKNGLTYNLRVGTSSNGVNTQPPMSNVSTGYRRVARLGNTFHDTSWVVKGLANGTYYWGVQAVDNTFAGSAFSTQSTFVVGPGFSASTSSIAYGNVNIGNAKQDSVTVTNVGSASLSITSVSSNNARFTVTPTSANVSAGGTQKFYITFTPTATGLQNGMISFTDNAPGSPQTVSVSGTGVQLTITATAGSNGTISPSGTVNVNHGASQTFTITPNSGYRADSIIVDGVKTDSTTHYTFTNITANRTIRIVFAVNELTYSPTSLSLGSVLLGTTKTDSLTVTNVGLVDLTISNVTSNNAQFSVTPTSVVVAASQSKMFYVTYSPTTASAQSATITFTHSGATSPNTVSVTGTGITPVFSVSPSSVSFGNVVLGTLKLDSVAVTNTGTASLNISNVSSDNAEFTVSPTSKQTISLAPNASQKFYVTFIPASTGAKTATITFNDDASGSPHSVSLSGTGTAPVFSSSANSVALGNVLTGTTKQDSVTITNTGTATLAITNVTSDNAKFTVTPTTGTIAPSATKKYYITFAPTAVGNQGGTISFTDNANGSPHSVSVNGTGVAPAFSVAPASIAFGNVNTTITKRDSIAVTNTGTATLNITNVTSNNAKFTVTPTSVALAPSVVQKFYVTFAPTANGNQSGTISFTDNASGSPHSVAVSGNGISPIYSASASTFSFGNVVAGQTKKDSVTISNTGNATLIISGITFNGNQYAITPATATIIASSSQKFYITFAPTSNGVKNDTIKFTHNASGSPSKISLSGTGIGPLFSLSSTTKSFGNVATYTTKTDTVKVTNSGTAPLTIISVSSSNGRFNISPQFITLNQNASAVFTISYSPNSTTYDTSRITFNYNALGTPTLLTVTGLGYGSIISVTPSSITFGDSKPTISKRDSILITNFGNAPLTVSSVTSSSTDFAVTPLTATINANANAKFYVTFTPASQGSKNATIKFKHNASGSPSNVIVNGRGAVLQMLVSKPSIAYPSIVVGETARDSFTVSNTGNLPLLYTPQSSNEQFVLSSTTQDSLGENSSRKYYVTFIPSALGAINGNITFTNNANNTQQIALNGFSGFPNFAMQPSTPRNFGEVITAYPKLDSVVISNSNGTADLKITNVVSSNSKFSVTPTTATIKANKSTTFFITFSPTDNTLDSGTISFTHNANSSPNTMGVSGSGFVSPGNAVSFISDGKYVSIPYNAGILPITTNEMTITMWIYANYWNRDATTGILEIGNSSLSVDKNRNLGYSTSYLNSGGGVTSGTYLSSPAPAIGTWHHIAITEKQGGSLELYIDGFLRQSSALASTIPGYARNINMQIGMTGGYSPARPNPTNYKQFHGMIDEVTVWNKQLSKATILSTMGKTITPAHPNYTNLVSYYKFNELSDTLIHDSKGNNNGFLRNGAAFVPSGAGVDKPAILKNKSLLDWRNVITGTTSVDSITFNYPFKSGIVTFLPSNPGYTFTPSPLFVREGMPATVKISYQPTTGVVDGIERNSFIALSINGGTMTDTVKVHEIAYDALGLSHFNRYAGSVSMSCDTALRMVPPQKFTIAFWTNSGAGFSAFESYVFSFYCWYNEKYRYNQSEIRIDNRGSVYLSGSYSAKYYDNTYRPNTWYHFAVTFNQWATYSDIIIYQDGRIIDQSFIEGNTLPTTGKKFLGASGLLDEVSLWKTVLTPEEIFALYQSGSAKYLPNQQANLLAYYNFEEGGTLPVLDASGNNHHANGTTNLVRLSPGPIIGDPFLKIGNGIARSYSFPTMNINIASTITASIVNPGKSPLRISSITSSDSAFKVTMNDTSSIPSGQSRDFTVTFKSARYDDFTGKIEMKSNAPHSPSSFYFFGKTRGATTLTVPTSLKFGNVTAGITNSKYLVIKNNTSADAFITRVDETYANYAVFRVSNPGRKVIAGNSTDSIQIDFLPELKEYSSTYYKLVVTTENAGTYTIPISGTGVYGGQFNVQTPTLHFEDIPLFTERLDSIIISNPGNGSVEIGAVNTYMQTSFQPYSFERPIKVKPFDWTIPAGGTRKIYITYTAIKETVFSGKIYISHLAAAPGGGTQTVWDSSVTFTASPRLKLVTESGNAITLSGPEKYTTANNKSDKYFVLDSAFSINVWLKRIALQPMNKTILLSGNSKYPTAYSYKLYGEGDDIKFDVNLLPTGSSTPLSFGVRSGIFGGPWKQVTITWKSGDSLKMFIDGILVSSASTAGYSKVNGSFPLFLGSSYTNKSGTILIDELIFWNYAKTEDDVALELSEGTSSVQGLLAYYNFNEGEGNTINDFSGNKNHLFYYATSGSTWMVPSTLDISPPDMSENTGEPGKSNGAPQPNIKFGDIYRGDSSIINKIQVVNKGGRPRVVTAELKRDTTITSGGQLPDSLSNFALRNKSDSSSNGNKKIKIVARKDNPGQINLQFNPMIVQKDSQNNSGQRTTSEKKNIDISFKTRPTNGAPPESIKTQTQNIAKTEGRTLPVNLDLNVGKSNTWNGLNQQVADSGKFKDTLRVRITPLDSINGRRKPPVRDTLITSGSLNMQNVDFTKAKVELLNMNQSIGNGKFVSNTGPKNVDLQLLQQIQQIVSDTSKKTKQLRPPANLAVMLATGMQLPPGFKYKTSTLAYTDVSLWGGSLPTDTSEIIIAYPGLYDQYNVEMDLTELNSLGTEVTKVKSLIVADSAEFSIAGSGEFTVAEQLTIHGNVTFDADSTATLIVGNLLIDGNFTVPSGKNPTMIVNGNMTISGTFDAGNSTVILNGETQQVISSVEGITANISLHKLVVNNDNAIISNNTIITDQLTLNANLAIGDVVIPTEADSNGNTVILPAVFNATSDTMFIANSSSNAFVGNGKITSGIVKRSIDQSEPGTYRFYDANTTIQITSANNLPSTITMTKLLDVPTSNEHLVVKNGTVDINAKNVTVYNVNPVSVWRLVSPNFTQGDVTGNLVYAIRAEGSQNISANISLGYDVAQLNGLDESSLTLAK
ncbi:MAG: choice-of-anchor D domain-containing protein, partial [Ignavibacteriales bacterium]|nr:choice-of-anchor D domain-containing protein [Ignavibacteriales bacterium]